MQLLLQIHNMTRDGDYVIHHATNVAILAGLMANWMRYPWEKTRELVMAGLFSEVGKMKVPKDILEKTEKLTSEELDKVKRHVEYGYDMLKYSELKKYKEVLLSILQHHERCDGSGYPNRLKSDAICDYAKIIAKMISPTAPAKKMITIGSIKLLIDVTAFRCKLS